MKQGTTTEQDTRGSFIDTERYAVSKYGILFVKDFERGEIRTLSHNDVVALGYNDISRYEAACAALLVAFGKARATIAAERGHLPKSRRMRNAERIADGITERYGGLLFGYTQILTGYTTPPRISQR